MFLLVLVTWCYLHTGMAFYTECGQTNFTSPTGTIQTPNYPSNYPPDTACIWTIAVATGDFVHLTFTTYTTQGCCDVITVYDGPSIASLSMAYFAGYGSSEYYSTSNTMTLSFASDQIYEYAGFNVEYETISAADHPCGPLGFSGPSGVIQSPNYPSRYPANSYCTWRIQVDDDKLIRLDFTYFRLESCCDFLYVYDGPETTNKSNKFTGSSLPSAQYSTSNTMLVRFQTDSSSQMQGFSVTYTEIEASDHQCGQMNHNSTSGSLQSPNFPSNYPNNARCVWTIQVLEGQVILLTFNNFRTESCCDKVSVYDGLSTSDQLLGSYSGFSSPSSQYSIGNTMTVVFESDVSYSYYGLSATYTAVDISQHPCPQLHYTALSGVITSSSYSSAETVHCSWSIEVATDNIIQLTFTSFSTSNGKVVVYDGSSSLDRIIGSFDGFNLPAKQYSTDNKMLVTFLPDSSVSQFSATYTTLSANSSCHSSIDMAIVIDASSSVTLVNFLKQLNFVNDVIQVADINSGFVRVSVQTYATGVAVHTHLNNPYTKQQLYRKVRQIAYASMATNTAGGLSTLLDQVFLAENGDRADVPNIAILITDGQSNYNSRFTLYMAEKVRNTSITLYTVGVALTDTTEIEAIASHPASQYATSVSTFDGLRGFGESLLQQICEDLPMTTTTKMTTVPTTTEPPTTTNTASTNPATTNTASTNQTTTNTASTNPATTNTASTNPATTNTASTNPATTNTASTNPATTSTASTNPATTNTASTNPTTINTASTNPATTNTASTNPATTNTAPTNPATTNTASTNPATTNTASTNPATTNTASTNPATTSTASTNPATTNTASTNPTTINTASTNPATTNTASTNPATTNTAPTNPATTNTASTTSATTNTASTNPATTNTASTNPATTNTASTNPATTSTASTNPATTNTASTNPTTINTASTNPATTNTASTNPATTNTAPTNPATTNTASTTSATTNTASTNPATTNTASTNPATTNTAPTNPATTNTASTTSATTNTASTNPATTNTASTNPATTNTASTNPATTNTASTNQATTNTASTNPATTNTASTNPATTNTASTNPATTSTASTNPATTNTASTNPATTNTASTNQATTNTASTNPATTNTASTNPATTNTASTNQATTNTASTNPATTNTASTNPATTNTASTNPATTNTASTNPATTNTAPTATTNNSSTNTATTNNALTSTTGTVLAGNGSAVYMSSVCSCTCKGVVFYSSEGHEIQEWIKATRSTLSVKVNPGSAEMSSSTESPHSVPIAIAVISPVACIMLCMLVSDLYLLIKYGVLTKDELLRLLMS